MRKHLRYASYVARHKWFVLVECWRRGLYWRGLTHDLSKLLPSEWAPYAEYFYGPTLGAGFAGGFYEPCEKTRSAFDLAWLKHQKRNDHHWQWWILGRDDGDTLTLSMSEAARLEMLCDWIGAGKAQGHTGPTACRDWYLRNREKMTLHEDTRVWVEAQLGIPSWNRGASDAYQDRCENCACASIGGLDSRSSPRRPHYIDIQCWPDYLAGYEARCAEMWGDDWRTAEFSWNPAMDIVPGFLRRQSSGDVAR